MKVANLNFQFTMQEAEEVAKARYSKCHASKPGTCQSIKGDLKDGMQIVITNQDPEYCFEYTLFAFSGRIKSEKGDFNDEPLKLLIAKKLANKYPDTYPLMFIITNLKFWHHKYVNNMYEMNVLVSQLDRYFAAVGKKLPDEYKEIVIKNGYVNPKYILPIQKDIQDE